MKSFTKQLLLLGALITDIYARNVKFSVISFGNSVQLSVGGATVAMNKEASDIPLWSVSQNVDDAEITYNYIADGNADVQRKLAAGATTTYNELIGRETTIFDMVEFEYPGEKWTRSIGRTKLFDATYIPTFVFSGYGDFFVAGSGSQNFSKMVVILKDEVLTFENIPTSGKNGDEDKFQFRVELPEPGIYNRNVLKFRPSSYDPVFFRQILYGDILHAVGCPAHESVAARVYQDDGTGIGLYVLQEDCTTESFIRTAFHGKSDGSIDTYDITPIYDCATGADFNFNDPNYLGAFINNTFDLKMELLEMTRQLDILDINNEDQVKSFSDNWLDLDTLFKALALEYLAGHWDSYWFLTSNFITYHPADESVGGTGYYSKYKYYFVDQDFDQTWGIGLGEQLDPTTFPTKSYKDFIGLDWANLNPGEDADSATRVIVDKLIGCGSPANKDATCYSRTLFENHLKDIVRYIFNPEALGVKIDAYVKRIRPEIVWDTQEITRLHQGTVNQFDYTVNDFDGNIESGNYIGSKTQWGIKDWVATRADVVCKEFNINFDDAKLVDSNGKVTEGNSGSPLSIGAVSTKFLTAIVVLISLVYLI